MSVTVFFLVIISIFFLYKIYNNKKFRLPSLIYFGSYFFTSVLGCLLLGTSYGNYFWGFLRKSTIQTAKVSHSLPELFYVLLLAPFIVVPIFSWILSKKIRLKSAIKNYSVENIDTMMVWLTAGAIVLFIFIILRKKLGIIDFSHTDYAGSIARRHDLMAALHVYGSGVIYTGFPALIYVCQYNVLNRKNKNTHWIFVFIFFVSLYFFLMAFCYKQKSLALLLVVILFFGYFEIKKRVRIKSFFILSIVLISLIFIYQISIGMHWSIEKSINLMVFRVGANLPFSYQYHTIAHINISMDKQALSLLHVEGELPVKIYNFMFKERQGVVGHVAIPSHFSAYILWGYLGYLFVLLATSLVMCFCSLFESSSPVRFAVKMLLYTMLYYLTQVGFTLCVAGSYSIIFGFIVLLLLIFGQCIKNKLSSR